MIGRISILFVGLAAFAGTVFGQPARLEQRMFSSALLGSRTFYVYLPPGYDSTAERYPVVVLLRGVETEWITPNQDGARRGSIMTVADSLWRSGALPPVILVMPRIASPPTWTDMSSIAEELLPWIDGQYRTYPTRIRRAVDGFSYGGLGSAMLITQAPERFISAGGYDGSLFLYDPSWLQLWKPDRRALFGAMQFLYTTTGPAAQGNQSTNRAFVDTLSAYGIANGFGVLNLTADAQHNWYFADLHASLTLPRHASYMLSRPQQLGTSAIFPPADTTVRGAVPISWHVATPSPSLRVYVQWTKDGGRRWHSLVDSRAADSSMVWNTTGVTDGTRYQIRVIAVDDTSLRELRTPGTFRVDNPGNGAPEVVLEPPSLEVLSGPVVVRWRSDDPESDPLTVAVHVSSDDGVSWTSLAEGRTAIDSTFWPTADFANGSLYRLKVTASDGQALANAVSPRYRLANTRTIAPYSVTRERGRSDVGIETRVVHGYGEPQRSFRIVMHRWPSGLAYSVRLANSDSVLVPPTPLGGPGDESPLFDGKRVVVTAVDTPAVWTDSTRWVVGSPDLAGLVSLPTIVDGAVTLRGIPVAEDYEITVTAGPSDTSMAALGVPAQPVHFSVRTVGRSVHPDFIFVDADLSGGLSHGDELYFVVSGSMPPLQLGWAIQFSGPVGAAPPPPGSVFRLRIRKPPEEGDSFIASALWNHANDHAVVPASIGLDPAYPNPFNGTTVIRFRTSERTRLSLDVIDLLGRRVATLADGLHSAGEYTTVWNADGVSSGVYLVRLQAGTDLHTRKIVHIK